MTKPFRPMLAEDATLENIERVIQRDGFVYASFKLDGIRALTINSGLYSRSMKPIPNAYVRGWLSHPAIQGLDGELICGKPFGEGVFARASSAFMTHGGTPQFTYHVFDRPNMLNDVFDTRLLSLTELVGAAHDEQVPGWAQIYQVLQIQVRSIDQLQALETEALETGYEGLIIKSPQAPYKQGRSTLKEGWMLKLKRFQDSEAVVIGFEELYRNQNEAKLDERGFTRRSSHQAGRVPAGMLGALVVRDLAAGWEFSIGSGFDHDLRRRIWADQARYRDKIVKYKFLPIGMKDVPRHPIFLAFRDPLDMD